MLKIEIQERVIIDRHEGFLGDLEWTHDYCTVGSAPDGTVLAFYGMHPDIAVPKDVCEAVFIDGSEYPIYKFNPLLKHPGYRWPYIGAYSRTSDGGRSWSKPVMTDGWGGAITSGSKTLSYYKIICHAGPGLAIASFKESDDNGVSWYDRPGVKFHYPCDLKLYEDEALVEGAKIVMNFENGGGVKTLKDGSIAALVTGNVKTDGNRWFMPLFFISNDGGYNFYFRGLPAGAAAPVNHDGFTEPALTQLANGDLLAVFRIEYHKPERVMMQCKSSDNGKTWTCPGICEGLPRFYPLRRLKPVVNIGKAYFNAANVSPWLATLSGGQAAMVYGRPGVYIVFSEDGTGDVWTDRIPIVPEPSLFGINDDSSHMAGVIEIEKNVILIIYDIMNYIPENGGVPGNTIFALRLTVY